MLGYFKAILHICEMYICCIILQVKGTHEYFFWNFVLRFSHTEPRIGLLCLSVWLFPFSSGNTFAILLSLIGHVLYLELCWWFSSWCVQWMQYAGNPAFILCNDRSMVFVLTCVLVISSAQRNNVVSDLIIDSCYRLVMLVQVGEC